MAKMVMALWINVIVALTTQLCGQFAVQRCMYCIEVKIVLI